ncbi:hypothetical protein [Bacteroides faecichinchillae]|nr:hypothetical protein [Bacteroides faecichinchillae]
MKTPSFNFEPSNATVTLDAARRSHAWRFMLFLFNTIASFSGWIAEVFVK